MRSALRTFFSRFHGLFTIRRLDDDFAQELDSHLALLTEENIRQGMPAGEARRAARLKLGSEATLRESHHDQRTILWLESVAQDVRFALRMLRKNPGFTILAVLTLALGIGANTAIFSAVNGILIDQLPYAKPSQLVQITSAIKIGNTLFYSGLSPQYLDEIRKSCPALSDAAGYSGSPFTMVAGSTPERIQGRQVSPQLFSLLGVAPFFGRPILPADATGGAGNVVVLSYQIWRNSFASDPHVLGRTITLGTLTHDGSPYTVVGVMPPGFEFPLDEKGVWVPLPASSGMSGTIARLKPGATRGQAEQQLAALAAHLPGPTKTWTLVARPLDENLTGPRNELPILLGAVAFVLLIACVNVSALLLARGAARRGEIAIREALGATRWRICGQLLTEGLLLSLLGAVVALIFAPWAIRLVRLIAPPNTPRIENVRLDAHVLWFALAIAVISAAAFALAPALQLSAPARTAAMQKGLASSRPGFAQYAARRFRDSLVVLEIALAVVLVIGAALVGRSFANLLRLNVGFHTDHILTMYVNLSSSTCSASVSCAQTESAILDRVRAIPQVSSAAFSSSLPFGGGMGAISNVSFEGLSQTDGFAHGTQILSRAISSDYFRTFGIPLLAGRNFQPADSDAPPSAIVNESFARRYFAGDALGKRISFAQGKDGNPLWYPIVGIVADSRDVTLAEAPPLEIYMYFVHMGAFGMAGTLIVRTSADPLALLPTVRGEIWSVDKNAPLTSVRTMDQVVADSVADPRFRTVLLGSFGAIGFLLAIVGTYGVLSFTVAQRSHEIGVRIALGAGRRDVLRLVLGHGMLLAGLGIVAGLAGSLALTRFLRSFLFGLVPNDPLTFAAVAVVVASAALAACYIPARRAMRVDPMVALRYE
jgi:predicted permease